MIVDVDAALRAVLEPALLGHAESNSPPGALPPELTFVAPTKEWASRRNKNPALSIYLYDIREEMAARAVGTTEHRTDGRVAARIAPARRFRLSYLATAWTVRPEDEHGLLDVALRCLVAFDHLPVPVDHRFTHVPVPVRLPLTVGQPPQQERALSELWSALGGELKPSLDIVVSAPLAVGVPDTNIRTAAETFDPRLSVPGEGPDLAQPTGDASGRHGLEERRWRRVRAERP